MRPRLRVFAFICFILSGTASVSYQLLWLRDAISHFGVITPVISVLLSVFMAGLAIGTYVVGRVVKNLSARQALAGYAIVELLVALLAISVPYIFRQGYELLLGYGSLASAQYFILSALIIAAALLPACFLIGATMPLMMRVLEDNSREEKNFGTLYYANLIGALMGCFLPLALAEAWGFHDALRTITLLNISAALLAGAFFYAMRVSPASLSKNLNSARPAAASRKSKGSISPEYKLFLFMTGFAAIGCELLWVKGFTPVTSSSVYAFALILGIYLFANAVGNHVYVCNASGRILNYSTALFLLPLSALLPVWALGGVLYQHDVSVVFSIAPLCFLFGYLTPQIIDRACANKPDLAARAYAYNFAGCILGPLCTGYLLFPVLGLKWSLMFHALLLGLAVVPLLRHVDIEKRAVAGVAFAFGIAFTQHIQNYEDYAQQHGKLYRDHIGYIAATGSGMEKQLTVNGIGMTHLTTITKDMVHLPMAYHTVFPPRSALVICMGMGTTMRSAETWPLDSITVVELSRGVVKAFPYFYDNAPAVLADPRLNIVVDDGRRFLLRSKEKFDVVVIDPPPPIEASGSGLLYSEEFVKVIADHLNDGGILAHWIPIRYNVSARLIFSIVAAIKQHFKYVRIFTSIDEGWGLHILASNSPVPSLTAQGYMVRLPKAVKKDIQEFSPGVSMETLAQKSVIEDKQWSFIPPETTPISDDRLLNEFYLLHRFGLMH